MKTYKADIVFKRQYSWGMGEWEDFSLFVLAKSPAVAERKARLHAHRAEKACGIVVDDNISISEINPDETLTRVHEELFRAEGWLENELAKYPDWNSTTVYDARRWRATWRQVQAAFENPIR